MSGEKGLIFKKRELRLGPERANSAANQRFVGRDVGAVGDAWPLETVGV